jgi:SWI/SNF-related matrix-associated actin-dependent regulator 1 of chromatin subfamily A
MSTETIAQTLGEAARRLAFVCNYAATDDKQGFSAFDADFGHRLAATPEAMWSPKMSAAAHKMLRKYRKQLAGSGIDFDQIPVPPDPATVVAPPRRSDANPINEQRAARPKLIALAGTKYELTFPYDPALVAKIKLLPVRSWDPTKKIWTVPADAQGTAAVGQFGHENGFEFSPAATARIGGMAAEIKEEQERKEKLLSKSSAATGHIRIEGLNGTLFPFQEAGAEYAILTARGARIEDGLLVDTGDGNVRCFIADQMGLGKTMQAIAILWALRSFPALIVVPASVKINWYRQIRKWLPGVSVEILDSGRRPTSYTAQIYIANYDILRPTNEWLAEQASKNKKTKKPARRPKVDHQPHLVKLGLRAIVLDESHNVKTKNALRTNAIMELAACESAKVRLCLSGTPLLNRPNELPTQLQFLGVMDRLFGSSWKFMQKYCGAYNNGYGWDTSGADHMKELNEILRANCYIRRLRKDVLTEMPAKTRNVVPVEIDNRDEYKRAEEELVEWLGEQAIKQRDFLDSIKHLLDSGDPQAYYRAITEHRMSTEERAARAEQLIRFTALKRLAARGKMAEVKKWIEEFLATGEKLIVFAHHTDIVKELAAQFHAPTIMGETPLTVRQAHIDRFQRDAGCNLLVLNMQAGGTGIDGLQNAASNCAFIELGWNRPVHDQAEDRLDRMGQTEPVTAHYLLAAETIDEEVQALIEGKAAVVDTVTDGTAPDDSNSGILAALVNSYRRRAHKQEALV